MTLLEDGERRVLYTGDFCDFADGLPPEGKVIHRFTHSCVITRM